MIEKKRKREEQRKNVRVVDPGYRSQGVSMCCQTCLFGGVSLVTASAALCMREEPEGDGSATAGRCSPGGASGRRHGVPERGVSGTPQLQGSLEAQSQVFSPLALRRCFPQRQGSLETQTRVFSSLALRRCFPQLQGSLEAHSRVLSAWAQRRCFPQLQGSLEAHSRVFSAWALRRCFSAAWRAQRPLDKEAAGHAEAIGGSHAAARRPPPGRTVLVGRA